MEIPSKYNPKHTEERLYNFWQDNGFFHSEPDDRPAYTIVIPPPNVTGVLHMGHMLNNTIQDILIRKARMSGFNACWVPGTDHASIATEAKVVKRLKEQGIEKTDLSRDEFLQHAWDWTHEHGGKILEQLKKLGASCDWERTKFTLDEDLSEAVTKVFVDLYNKGKIYRGYRMVNWDPEAKTNISDEEVIFKEQNGKLYYLKYKIEGSEEFLQVATTRPETIFGDVAICVNPEDERYKHLVGKKVIVPIVNRAIPIIADEYVDIEFGTGALKITPAHDTNDYEIGKKYDLEIIDALDDDGRLNQHGLHYNGKDRFEVRKLIAQELEEKDLLLKAEDYVNKVGTSERTGAVIEPKLSVQWYLKMKELAQKALDAVADSEVKLYPDKFRNTWNHWLENVHDWNISRQLWWGHRIPAYFYGDGMEDYVVAETAEQALALAQEKTNNTDLKLEDLKQDEDALDTWFSSWLWPISVFNGINEPENEEIKYYYPTRDLVTGPDIMFFWVARMVMAGYEYRQEQPFSNVYFTGLVRDKQRRKMSKSLGNSPDPIELMTKYGADGVRVGLMLASSAGNDLLFDEDLCLQGRNFANKIWNAFRLVYHWETAPNEETEVAKNANTWFKAKFNKTLSEMNHNFEQFRISDALMSLYKLIWDDFCSWYLEAIKPDFQQPIAEQTKAQAIAFLEDLIKLLHPFMPFLTEEIWQNIKERKVEEALIVSSYPEAQAFDEKVLGLFENSAEIVSGIRTIRKEKNIPNKEKLNLFTENSDTFLTAVVEKLGNLNPIEFSSEKPNNAQTFRVGVQEFHVPLEGLIDAEAEIEKLEADKKYLEGFLKSVEKKLSNERFVANAPEQVVAMERKKQADATEKIALIEEQLKSLRG
ncbi:valine--tRNA ligase [Ornithobacterium rhinotracheale]|uniref:Valine--tRNA ligase n=1 Tax=Ornithobacterium rhinotracheale (strain ATCC 51463 / DSM 15997 / CCUG 23171 / CIP 104009 / LMG 9086) TaxID=867902 RepID=I4A0T6_ORNRL|nr:valine--tRNA ligase [Ornithobacterium rhinotracheale]AFL97570.1 valyl-tRNA synthetase [Ornithobacterium rhinotracheale DSM 15997]AIP98911.1 valyl-tRNA synthetase [Ornithobacterium rhinotracheale ORT-UMN 88]KGB66860.1 valyl-tRNA synthetase [Ornithobacterium rhinotracheale H06-030791]MBN3661873.1 valine--tRNA ligase [Ornithobacterium rhinotracheale]MCK0195064.1 valine--tRNA ligase [Ornithobacterium rhinotracheale]